MPDGEPEKKKRGPKATFEKTKDYHRGAPRLATRVDPDVLEWIESRPEGTRTFLERIVREDRDRAGGQSPMDLTDQQEQAAEA